MLSHFLTFTPDAIVLRIESEFTLNICPGRIRVTLCDKGAVQILRIYKITKDVFKVWAAARLTAGK